MLKINVKRSLLAMSLMILGSCAVVESEKVSIPLPHRPVLPPINGEELACLSDDTYNKLIDRFMQLRRYSEKLEVLAKRCQ